MEIGAAIGFILWAVLVFCAVWNGELDYPKTFVFLIAFVGLGGAIGYLIEKIFA